MTAYTRFEVKVASLIVGVIVFFIALMIATPSEYEPLHVVLHARGIDDEFGAVMTLLAGMILYGSIRPKRACRQIGLILTGIFLLAIFGVVMVNWGLSFSTLLVFVFALTAIALFAGDVLVYRNECDAQGR